MPKVPEYLKDEVWRATNAEVERRKRAAKQAKELSAVKKK